MKRSRHAGLKACRSFSLSVATLLLATGFAPADDLARARALLARTPVIDGHNDVPMQVPRRAGGKIEGFAFERLPDEQQKTWQTDIDRMRRGNVAGQFWSIYVDPGLARDEAVRATLDQLDIMRRLIERHDALVPTVTAAETVKVMKQRRIASLLGVEGGHSIGNSLGVLRQLHGLGVGYLTLTHSKNTDWADSGTDAPRHGGLAPFGVEVVREMNRLGMLVDLSHTSPATMHDALDASQAPVIFSHSNVRALADHARNIPDDVLKRVPANGGIVMVTFFPGFISPEVVEWRAAYEGEETRLRALHLGDPATAKSKLEAWVAANPRPKATVAQLADHVDHLRKVVGIDHIGIGSDFDGIPFTTTGLEDVAAIPNLFAELLRRGYSQTDLAKIAQGNILRVMAQAEQVGARLRRERQPSEARLD